MTDPVEQQSAPGHAACLLGLLLVLVLTSPVMEAVAPKWIKAIDEQSSLYTDESPKATRVLADGSIMLVTREAGTGLATIRYDNAGSLLGSALLAFDNGAVVAIGPFGEVFVATSTGTNTVVCKFDGYSGRRMWSQLRSYGTFSQGEGLKLAIDSTGSVFMARGGLTDYHVAKLNGVDGSESWSMTLTTPGSGSDTVRSLVVDHHDNPIVAIATGFSGSQNIFTAKFSEASGGLVWSTVLDLTQEDLPVALAVDWSDNVFLTGTIRPDTDTDIVTLKYGAADGSELWRRTYDGTTSGDDESQAIAVDAVGDVFVHGSSRSGSYVGRLTIKYGATGVGGWTAELHSGSNERPHGLVLLGNGDVVVATQTGSTDFRASRLRGSDGLELWSSTYNNPSGLDDVTDHVVLTTDGNVVLVGHSQLGSSSWDVLATKFASSNGALQWARAQTGLTHGYEIPVKTVIDPAGDVIVGARYAVDGGSDFLISKLSRSTGSEIWRRVVGYSSFDTLNDLVVDGAGNVYAVGSSGGTLAQMLTVKINGATGAVLWNSRLGGFSGKDVATSVALHPTGDVIVAGYERRSSGDDAWLAWRLSGATGAATFGVSYSGLAGQDDNIYDVAVDAAGYIYATGKVRNYANNDDLVTVAWAPTGGAPIWATTYDVTTGDRGTAIEIGASGDVFVTGLGLGPGPSSGTDLVTIRYNKTTGAEVWRAHYAGCGTYSLDRGEALVADPSGGIVVAGRIAQCASPDRLYEAVTIRYDEASGAELWARTEPAHSLNDEHPVYLGIDPLRNAVMATRAFTDPGRSDDVHIAKYSLAGAVVWKYVLPDFGDSEKPAGLAVPAADQVMLLAGRAATVFNSMSAGFRAVLLTESLAIEDVSMPPGYCEQPYEHTFAAGGGTPPYIWSYSGTLPYGLGFNPLTGKLSGTLTVEGPASFTIRATDSLGAYVERAFTVDGFSGYPYIVMSASQNPACGTITLGTTSGPFLNYFWPLGGQWTAQLTTSVSNSTLFGLRADQGTSCFRRGAIVIEPILPLSPTSISVSGNSSLCQGGTGGTARVSETGGGSITRQWGFRSTSGGAITPLTGETGVSYTLDAADFPGYGTYLLVCTTTPSCGVQQVSNELTVAIYSFTPPGGLMVTAESENQVALAWTAAGGSGIDHYNVYRSDRGCPGSTFVKIGETSSTQFVDTDVVTGASYAYTVAAASLGNVCESARTSCEDAVAFGDCGVDPSFFGATQAMGYGDCRMTLSWGTATSNCPLSPSIVYNVYRSTSSTFTPAPSNLIAPCVTRRQWDDDSGVSGTTYYYIVRAEDSSVGNGGPCGGGNEDANTVRLSMDFYGSATTQVVYSDKFEAPDRPTDADAYWKETATLGTDHLGISTCYSSSGTSSYRWSLASSACPGAYNSSVDSRLTFGGDGTIPGINGIVLPVGLWGLQLRFKHRYDTESSWDGATLYYSTVSATSGFEIVPETGAAGKPFIVAGPYTATLNPDGRRAWSGSTSGAFRSVDVNLDNLAGQTVWFQWRFTSDTIINGVGYFLDDVRIDGASLSSCTVDEAGLGAFAATCKSTGCKLQWLNPAIGYDATVIRARSDGTYPNWSGVGVTIADATGVAGAVGSALHSATPDGTIYRYSGFVRNSAGAYSAASYLEGRPIDTSGSIRWTFHTAASATTPPGILAGKTYVVSNDRVYHGLNTGAAGGDWAPSWVPASFNAPSQSRTLVLQIPVAGVTRTVTLIGTQDGYAHCIDGVTGAVIWTSPKLGDVVQGSPVAISTVYGSSFSLVLAGARNADGTGRVYGLNPDDGSIAWSFENSLAQGGDGLALGAVSDAVNFSYTDHAGKRRAWFASRRKAGGSNHTLWCVDFDATSVSRVWSADLGSIDGFPMISGSLLFVGTNGGKVYSIYAHSGELIWVDPISTDDGPVKVTVWPDEQNLRLYFSTTNYVWSADFNGVVRWRKAFVAPSTPNRRTSELLLGAGDGRVYQIRNLVVDDPALLDVRSVLVSDSAQPPYVGAPTFDRTNSLIYTGTDSGVVYAVQYPIP